MADTLFDALSGLNTSGAENPYGAAAISLGQVTPQLITPYTSTGRAISISLGSVLLQSLLGYQARQQAARDTLEMNTLANQMMKLQTPEERTSFIGGVDDTLYQSRLSSLATALTSQQAETQRKLNEAVGLETGKIKAMQEFYNTPEGIAAREFELRKIKEEGEARRTPLEDYLAREAARRQTGLDIEKEKQTGRKSLEELKQAALFGRQEDKQAYDRETQQIQNNFTASQNKFKLEFGTEMAVKKEADIAAQIKKRIDEGADPTLARAQILQASKAELDKATEDKKQAYRIEMERLKQQNKLLQDKLKLENPEVPAATINETSEAIAIGNQARALAKRIKEKINNYPELKLAQNFSSAGEGLGEEIKDLSDLVLRVRTGAAAPLLEQERLGEMLIGTPESGPETVSMLLNKFADRTFTLSADRLAAASTKTSDLINMARSAASSGNLINLTAPAGFAGGKDEETAKLEEELNQLKQMLQQVKK